MKTCFLENLSRGCHYHLPRSATELVLPSLQQKSQFQFRPSEITPYFVNVKQLKICLKNIRKSHTRLYSATWHRIEYIHIK